MKSFSMHLLVLLCLLGGILPCGAQPDRRDSLIGRNAGNSYTSPSENQVSGSKFGYFLKADRETPEEQFKLVIDECKGILPDDNDQQVEMSDLGRIMSEYSRHNNIMGAGISCRVLFSNINAVHLDSVHMAVDVCLQLQWEVLYLF